MSTQCLFWFRQDLRLSDNPGLAAAANSGKPLILVYCRENAAAKNHGGAAKWWLDKSLQRLSEAIEAAGGHLTLTESPIEDLVAEHQIDEVHWNRRYAPDEIERDSVLKSRLESRGVSVTSHNASLLNEPWTVKSGSGGPYKVFTPYWKAVRANHQPGAPLPAPQRLEGPKLSSASLPDWDWHPTTPDWSGGLAERWTPGEAAAHQRLERFISSSTLHRYKAERDCPSKRGTSSLSPYLRHGEISPRQIWAAVMAAFEQEGETEGGWTFLSEVVWREFSYHLLYHFPHMVAGNFKPGFDGFPWADDPEGLARWQRGQTGYPLIDAGMRELYATGWMHNRVRMITASFLIKHLMIDWRAGEAWFWDCLVDADPASNVAGWQWVAGSGADASPYFRIFNPMSQGEKFSAHAYVRKWVPEVAKVSDKYLFAPFDAPDHKAGTGLFSAVSAAYPGPIVDHKQARERALQGYEIMKQQAAA